MVLSTMKRLAGTWLFTGSRPLAGIWDIITWWEVRRIAYNLIVAIAGIITSATAIAGAAIAEYYTGESLAVPDPPIAVVFWVVSYAIGANVCYTGGWVAELIVFKLRPADRESFARVTFFLGIAFSVLFTLFIGFLFAVLDILFIVMH